MRRLQVGALNMLQARDIESTRMYINMCQAVKPEQKILPTAFGIK
jgi:hypothetical protein